MKVTQQWRESMISEVLCIECEKKNPCGNEDCLNCAKPLIQSYQWKDFIHNRLNKVFGGFISATLLSITLINIDSVIKNVNIAIEEISINIGNHDESNKSNPPEVENERKVIVTYGDNKAEVSIYLLTDEYKWEIGWDNQLNQNYEKLPLSGQMINILNNESHYIICVGASSEEIQSGYSLLEGRILEEDRARNRAEMISLWVKEKLYKDIPVLKLNAGHWLNSTEGLNTERQRRVIIITVKLHKGSFDKNIVLREALKRKSGEQELYEILLTDYSLTKGKEFEWVP